MRHTLGAIPRVPLHGSEAQTSPVHLIRLLSPLLKLYVLTLHYIITKSWIFSNNYHWRVKKNKKKKRMHAQSCPTLCNLIDLFVHVNFQAKILEWVAISFSKSSSWSKDQTCISCTRRRILYHLAIDKKQQQKKKKQG